jgi:hypothetical protein
MIETVMTPDEMPVGIEAHLHAEGKVIRTAGSMASARARRPSRNGCRLDLDHELRIGEAGDAEECSRRSGSLKPGMHDA